MPLLELTLWPEEAFNEDLFPAILYSKLGLPQDGSVYVYPVKRSIDARSKKVCVRFQCEVVPAAEFTPTAFTRDYHDVKDRARVIIVGCGPAGLFAALRLIELGYKPVLLER